MNLSKRYYSSSSDYSNFRTGCDFLSFQLIFIFIEKPDPPHQPTSGIKTSRWIEVTWKPTFNGHSPIKSYTIEYKRHSQLWAKKVTRHVLGNTTKTIIRNLSPGVYYNVRIIASNQIGESEPSENNIFRTDEEGMMIIM